MSFLATLDQVKEQKLTTFILHITDHTRIIYILMNHGSSRDHQISLIEHVELLDSLNNMVLDSTEAIYEFNLVPLLIPKF